MFHQYTIIAILATIISVSTACNFKREFNTVTCSSLAEISQEGIPEWHVLKVKNFGNTTLETLRYRHFRNVPNLQVLTLQGITNSIGKQAFGALRKLQKVEFFDNKIVSIPSSLFENLPLENIYVVNSTLRELIPGTFHELSKLRSVFIRNNSIHVLPADVFSDTPIEELYLEHNGFTVIENYAFINMPQLSKLSLTGNNLSNFDAKRLLGSNTMNIHKLWLNQNQLTTIVPKQFVLLPKLKYLLLHSNLISTIEKDAFSGLDALIGLELSGNLLYTISPDVFPETGMPKMDLLFLHNNRMTFFTDIFERAPNLKFVTIYGNPLQCPCEVDIKNYLAKRDISIPCGKDSDGRRPVCITSEISNKCIKSVHRTRHLYEEYVQLSKNFENWNEKCDFLEGYEHIGWAQHIHGYKAGR